MHATVVANRKKVRMFSVLLSPQRNFLFSLQITEKPKVKKLGVEIGKDAAEKSKGLFSADDWMCTK